MTKHRDTWTTDETGHYVGHDGFVCPATCEEFLKRFPAHLKKMAFKSLSAIELKDESARDREQDFAVKLLSGKIVERFDPAKLGGANASRFFSYINHCLIRHAHSMHRAAHNNVRKANVNAISMTGIDNDGNEEWMYHRIDNWAEVTDDRIMIEEFRKLLPTDELVRTFDALLICGTVADAARMLSVSYSRVSQCKKMIQEIAEIAINKGAKNGRVNDTEV